MREINQTIQNLITTPKKNLYLKAIEQLKLKTKLGDREDSQQLKMLLTQILTYPTIQLAQLHKNSDRLGMKDLHEENIQSSFNNNNEYYGHRNQQILCPCCGFVKQEKSLKICTNLRDINNVGISTQMYFLTIKQLIILLIIMTVVYSIYALITNLKAAGAYDSLVTEGRIISIFPITKGYLALSIGSKQMNPTDENAAYYLIQCWIGIGLVIIWMITIFIFKYYERSYERYGDLIPKASQFTIMLENAPIDLTQQQLQQAFNQYQREFYGKGQPLIIVKMNKVQPFQLNEQDFEDQQLTNIIKKKRKLIEEFVQWIKQRQKKPIFKTSRQRRQEKYNQFRQLINQQRKRKEKIIEKFKQKIKQRTQSRTTTFFVTFSTSHAMKKLTRLNESSFCGKIFSCLNFCSKKKKFQIARGLQKFQVNIEKAPEPEDIIWQNFKVSQLQKIKRKIITYLITFTLIGISFLINYGLTIVEVNRQDIPLIKAIFLSAFNLIIPYTFQKLCRYQMNFTLNQYKKSIEIKSIIASLINSILIPMITSYYVKTDIYVDLVEEIFNQALTNSVLFPINRLINFPYLINRFIKYLAQSPINRLPLNQKQLNEKFQFPDFQFQYEQYITMFLFTCYFVSLEPIISIISACGMGIMYWIQKYHLFHRVRRPNCDTDQINVQMFEIILYGGFVFCLGSMTWSNFMPGGIPKQAIVPNLIAISISIIMVLLPYKNIYTQCFKQNGVIHRKYRQCRIFFQSEYDMLNPLTSESAIAQFRTFFYNQLRNLEKLNQAEKNQFYRLFKIKKAKGHKKIPLQMMRSGDNLKSVRQAPNPSPNPPTSSSKQHPKFHPQIILEPELQQTKSMHLEHQNILIQLPSLNGLIQ